MLARDPAAERRPAETPIFSKIREVETKEEMS